MITHAYLKYAIALLMEENELTNESDITFSQIKREITIGLETFCVKPKESYVGKQYVKFDFVNELNKATQYVFLSPNAITTEKYAGNLYKTAQKVCESNILNLEQKAKVTQSQMPTSGEFCSFSDTGNIGRGKPEASNLSICLGLITSMTPLKPCLQNITVQNDKVTIDNICLIPDLEIPQLIDFIKLFKRLSIQKLPDDLMIGKVDIIKGKKETFKPTRPKLRYGNFPNAPRSSTLGSIALLGTIGEMIKEKDKSDLAQRVLESFKGINFYAFKYGDAQVFQFNHHIIDLAKSSCLRSIVDSLYYVLLYNQGMRRTDNIEYQKFDLFSSRFLQLFNKPAFKDFLSFRAEYPKELETLLTTYFVHMEHISEEIVQSAKALGLWLNNVAYHVANAEAKNKEKLREVKAKVLVELESSIFASKSQDALIAQTIARAGRLSADDAPAEATLFMEKAFCGDLTLEQTKNLLIAFSRLRSSANKGTEISDGELAESSSNDEYEEDSMQDYSNI